MKAAILILAVASCAYGASLEIRLETADCGTHTMAEGERLAIQSPNFPKDYPVDERCQWEISCPSEDDHYLEFVCPTFDLQSSPDCVNDRLVIASRGERDTKCGTDSPDGMTTSTGWTRLTFFSNADKVAQGFRCYIWCRAAPTVPTTTTSTTAATTTAGTTTAATTTAGTTTAATTTAGTTTAATTTAGTTTAATTTAGTTTAATTTAGTTTAATTTVGTTTAATTTAGTTTAATTTAGTTTAATTTAGTTVPASTTAASSTTACMIGTTTAGSTTTAATTTAGSTTTAATTTAGSTTTAATTTAASTTTAATTTAPTTTAATTTAATTTAATTTAATTTAATTTAATTTAATTTAATTTAATTTAATTTAATTTAATTTAATTTAATTTAATTTAATTTAPTTTAATTTTTTKPPLFFDLKPCGVYELVPNQRVIIQSTNFPKAYANDERCQWEFSCPEETANYLDVICPKFSLEDSTDCTKDKLIVTSRGERDVKCGTDSPDGTQTSTGWARFTYRTDSSGTDTGFRCYIWCRPK